MTATVPIDVIGYKMLIDTFLAHAPEGDMVILDWLPLPDAICNHCGCISDIIVEGTYKPFGVPLCPRCDKPLDE